MNLSFSTRGWPELTWDEMMELALDNGFSGIEVYNLPKFNPLMDRSGPFHKYQTAATIRQLKEKKLSMVLLMLTDVLLEGTQLVYVGDDEIISQAFNAAPKDNVVFLPRVMSRKKQIIPSLSALWG